jgi:hypothetical protein
VQVTTYATLALLTGVCTWYRPRGRLPDQEIVDLHVRLAFEGLMAAPHGAARGSAPRSSGRETIRRRAGKRAS